MRSILLIYTVMLSSYVYGQHYNEKISKEFTFEKKSSSNTVLIANINGNVTVVGYEGDKILVEVNKSVSGKTEARLEKGKLEVQLGFIDRADTLIFFTADGCNSFGNKGSSNNQSNGRNNKKGWGYNWNCNNGDNDCRQDYDYKMDFTVKVPSNVNVIISTINEGDIIVEKISGAVKANNVNGSIKLSNLEKEAIASTINGDVDIDYTRNPMQDCRFYSLNGDINALFQKGLAANLSFESFNGEFYTNVDKIEPLPVKVEKSNTDEGIKFKVNGNRYQIGNGGVYLDFETFNGNVYLKEK